MAVSLLSRKNSERVMELNINTLPKSHDIYLNGDISELSVGFFVEKLNSIVDEDNTLIANNINAIRSCGFDAVEPKRPEINIHLSTYGGSVYDGLSAYDAIMRVRERYSVSIYCSGKVMSAGTFILQAGTKRIASPNTLFMVHDISTVGCGKLTDLQNSLAHTVRLREMINKIYTERTYLTEEQLNEIYDSQKDLYFNAKEALDVYGLIDMII